jgi:CSLREA domain-containing protein
VKIFSTQTFSLLVFPRNVEAISPRAITLSAVGVPFATDYDYLAVRREFHTFKGVHEMSSYRHRNGKAIFYVSLAAACSAIGLSAGAAQALTFTVNTASDTHDASLGDGVCRDSNAKCSLRAAIEENNRLSGNAIINVPAYTITLNTTAGYGQLDLTAAASIYGAGAGSTIIDGGGHSRVMRVNVISVIVSGLTMRNGNGCKDASTCDVFHNGGELLVDTNGWVTARHSVFTTTMAIPVKPFPGGGIYVSGVLDMTDSTVSNNSTTVGASGGSTDTGGGICIPGSGNAQIYYSTISGNAAIRGGGIGNAGGILKLVNSTVSGNSSKNEGGGGLFISGSGRSDVMYTTIADNQIISPLGSSTFQVAWGAGIRTYQSVLNLGKSIVAYNNDNRSPSDAYYSPDIGQDDASSIVSYDDNFILATGNHLGNYYGADGVAWDFFNDSNISLGFLADNGGETQTNGLWGGDPIDSYSGDGGDARFAAPGDDQTHFGRPDDGNGDGVALADSGSFEF